MKTILFASILFTFVSKCIEMQSDLMLKKIASFAVERDGKTLKVKEVFLSNIIEETWLGSALFCNNFEMDLLRIETKEEVSKVFRYVNINF